MHRHVTHIAKRHIEHADLTFVANGKGAILYRRDNFLHCIFRALHADVVSIGLKIMNRWGTKYLNLVEALQGTGLYHSRAI